MEEKELKQELKLVEKKIGELVVVDKDTYAMAGQVIIDIDGMIKRVNQYWEDPIKKAFEAHRALTAKRGEMLKPLEDRRKIIKKLISDFATEQARKQREEQARLNLEREERERKEREKLEKAAVKAEEKGQTEKAESLRERAEEVNVPLAIVEPEIKKTVSTGAGSITQTNDISVTITDPLKILQAVISGRIPITIVNINETKLKKAIKDYAINNLDGCIIVPIVNTSFRSKK
jgi:predicted ribosome quality control (RQC) complex YloA/Tae2 family protein